MNALWSLINLLVFIQIVTCRDFYLGMFRRNDFLVAQDVLYKAPSPFGYTTASYGRFFKCPITYFRVVDRLGMGRGPITTIVRGGLRKRFIAVRMKSTYRHPISVNIYVGCENKNPSTFRTTFPTTKLITTQSTTEETEGDGDDATTADDDDGTTEPTTSNASVADEAPAAVTDATEVNSDVANYDNAPEGTSADNKVTENIENPAEPSE